MERKLLICDSYQLYFSLFLFVLIGVASLVTCCVDIELAKDNIKEKKEFIGGGSLICLIGWFGFGDLLILLHDPSF